MAKVDIFMPFYVGDYLKDTNRLSAAEHGAYLMLMLDYWQNGPIPDDERILFRLSRMSASEWAESREVLLAYFKRRDGKLFHSRIDRELSAAKSRSDRYSKLSEVGVSARKAKAAVNGTVDGEVNGKVHRGGNPSHSHSHSHSYSESYSKSHSEVEEESIYRLRMDELKNNPTIETAVAAIRVCHPAFEKVAKMHLENSLRGQPDTSVWHSAISGLAARYAGDNLPQANQRLQNWLAGKNDQSLKGRATI